MKKKIKDCTFKEFTGWANARACDGRWSMLDAMNSVSIISMVYEVKPIFFRGRVREALWRKLSIDGIVCRLCSICRNICFFNCHRCYPETDRKVEYGKGGIFL